METPPPAIVAPAPEFLSRHAAFRERSRRGGIDVVLLGDSISDFFPEVAPAAWGRLTSGLGTTVNYGISGERTGGLLWRVDHGELEGSNARVVVIEIGTNDLANSTSASVASGIQAVVYAVRERLPRAVIVLSALLPREDRDSPLRLRAAEVNALIKPLTGSPRIRWSDPWPALLRPDGTLPAEYLPDGLHPSAKGYDVWGSVLRQSLIEAIGRR